MSQLHISLLPTQTGGQTGRHEFVVHFRQAGVPKKKIQFGLVCQDLNQSVCKNNQYDLINHLATLKTNIIIHNRQQYTYNVNLNLIIYIPSLLSARALINFFQL